MTVLIDRYLKRVELGGYLFPSEGGGRMNNFQWSKAEREYFGAAGMEGVTTNNGRHAIAGHVGKSHPDHSLPQAV